MLAIDHSEILSAGHRRKKMGWASLRPSISSGGNDDESVRDFLFVCLPWGKKGKLPSLNYLTNIRPHKTILKSIKRHEFNFLVSSFVNNSKYVDDEFICFVMMSE